VLIAEGIEGERLSSRADGERSCRLENNRRSNRRNARPDYQKRSGWILTGVAPNCGSDTNLQDIVLALQTEIPLVKQHLSDTLWCVRGKGVHAERFNRLTSESQPITLTPSRSRTIRHGFAQISRFSLVREELRIDEEVGSRRRLAT